jgi:hypothetical protein
VTPTRWQRAIARVRGPDRPDRHWRHTVAEILELPLRPPTNTRKNRLGRKAMQEVTIYLGEDNTIYVQHLSMAGKGQAEVAIRMCWEAMQHLAMRAGLVLDLPTHAAVPVQIMSAPPPPLAPEPALVAADNGSP